MRVLDLFSGIGGFSLGLERAGMRTMAFCEIDPFCRSVLAQHWPGIPIYEDVRKLTADILRRDGIAADLICGGFPCQDISKAGRGAGIDGDRSGLWSEYARLIRELRPSHVIVENVAVLLGRGIDRVLGDLAALGYDAEWDCIPASAVGAPHERWRVWIVAYPNSSRMEGSLTGIALGGAGPWRWRGQEDLRTLTNAPLIDGDRWPQPMLRRVADGVPGRVDRLRALGNAVVPQIPEIIGRAIMSADGQNI